MSKMNFQCDKLKTCEVTIIYVKILWKYWNIQRFVPNACVEKLLCKKLLFNNFRKFFTSTFKLLKMQHRICTACCSRQSHIAQLQGCQDRSPNCTASPSTRTFQNDCLLHQLRQKWYFKNFQNQSSSLLPSVDWELTWVKLASITKKAQNRITNRIAQLFFTVQMKILKIKSDKWSSNVIFIHLNTSELLKPSWRAVFYR